MQRIHFIHILCVFIYLSPSLSLSVCILRCSRQIKSISLFQQRTKAFLAKCDNDIVNANDNNCTPENCVNTYIIHTIMCTYIHLFLTLDFKTGIEMKISPCFANYKHATNSASTMTMAMMAQKVDFVCKS